MNGIPGVQMCEDAQSASLTTLIESGKVKEIPLTMGMVAIVDSADYERLSKHKWHAYRGRYTFYAARKFFSCDYNKEITISMHRQLLGMSYGDGKIGDHKNGNGLDNRRLNLREASHTKNLWNTKMRSHNTSGYRGLYWFKKAGKWNARIRVNNVTHSLGLFIDKKDAAVAYDKAALEYHGEFASLNFPIALPS